MDRDLTDSEWAEVAREAMRRLGFDAGNGQPQCRWVGVRHGRSKVGNDHMHLVVNLVRENGKVASTRSDFKRHQVGGGPWGTLERKVALSRP